MRKGGLYLAIGDSITWTLVTKGADLYASRITTAISSNYAPIRHINKGIGGATSTELVDNLYWSTTFTPDLVTVGIGMNDSANQGVAVATYQTNLEKIVDALKSRNPEVHIILCKPGRTTDGTRTPYIQAYRDAMATVATNKNVSICNFDTAWTAGEDATYLQDGIHPNSAGHAKLYDVLWPIVQKGAWLSRLR